MSEIRFAKVEVLVDGKKVVINRPCPMGMSNGSPCSGNVMEQHEPTDKGVQKHIASYCSGYHCNSCGTRFERVDGAMHQHAVASAVRRIERTERFRVTENTW